MDIEKLHNKSENSNNCKSELINLTKVNDVFTSPKQTQKISKINDNKKLTIKSTNKYGILQEDTTEIETEPTTQKHIMRKTWIPPIYINRSIGNYKQSYYSMKTTKINVCKLKRRPQKSNF